MGVIGMGVWEMQQQGRNGDRETDMEWSGERCGLMDTSQFLAFVYLSMKISRDDLLL